MARRLITLVSMAMAVSAAAGAETKVASAPDWDTRPIFSDSAAVSGEEAAIAGKLSTIEQWKGHLNEPRTLLSVLDLRSELRARMTRLNTYADMRLSREADDAAASADAAAVSALLARLNGAVAYIEPELVALGPARLAVLAADPTLARHRFALEQLGTRAAHVLPADQEALVAGLAPLQTAPSTIRDVFTNAELPWPTVDVHGVPRRLNVQAFKKTLQDPDRDTRHRAWEAFSKTRAAFQNTEAALLSAYLSGEAWEAKLRHWPSQIDFLTASDPMPAGAFAALTREAESAAQGPMTRYLTIKAHALGLSAPTKYDLSAPFIADTRRFTVAQAKELTLAAVTPLGGDYRDRLAHGMAAPLMDWHPQPTKGSGARTFYVAADIPGYVELSFTGDYDDVSVIAHEWGHWMHWEYSRVSGRPYETLFPPITVGDAPSYLHELLLADRQIESATSRETRIAALSKAIELLRSTYYEVVSQASFEIALREASDRGDTLDADRVSDLYCTAHKRFAPAGVAWDKRDCLGWVTEPYVYFDLYFYRYLLATSAAAWFAEKVEQGDAQTIDRFKAFLAAGGSADASVLLRNAGFDPADPAAYGAMTRRLERLVTMLDHEWAAEGKPAR